jgi:hypothetical protein
LAIPSRRSTSPANVPAPSTIQGRRQIGTTAVRAGPWCAGDQTRRAWPSHAGSAATPHAASIRRRLVNAPASVVGAVTQTAIPSPRNASTSASWFSSALARTRSGRSARTRSRSGYFDPPTLATSSPAGWVQ